MRASSIPLWWVMLLAAGCITQPDREAIVGGAKVLTARGEAGDEEAGAAAVALWQVAADVGAIKITPEGGILPGKVDPALVDTTPAASLARAQTIATDRNRRSVALTFASSLLQEVLGRLSWGAPALALAGGLFAALKKLKGVTGALTQLRPVVDASVTLFQRAKESLADGKLTMDEFKALFAQANSAGPQFLDGAAGLKQAYEKVKAEWAADGTPIKSV